MTRHIGRLKLGSKPAQLYVGFSIRPLGQQVYHVDLGNYKVLCSNSSVRLFTFYTLYIYIYIYRDLDLSARMCVCVCANKQTLCMCAMDVCVVIN